MNNTVIDSRVPLDTETPPVQIKEEHFKDLEDILSKTDELNQLRQEMGRLFQVITNVREMANNSERELTTLRQNLVSEYGLDSGRWALDFNNKNLVKLAKNSPPIP